MSLNEIEFHDCTETSLSESENLFSEKYHYVSLRHDSMLNSHCGPNKFSKESDNIKQKSNEESEGDSESTYFDIDVEDDRDSEDEIAEPVSSNICFLLYPKISHF